MSDRIFTVEELAARWGCNTSTVYFMLERGKLRGFKVGREWRISGTAIETYEKGEN